MIIVMSLILSIAATESSAGESLLVLPEPAAFGQAPAMPRLVDDLPDPSLDLDRVCYPARLQEAIGQWIDYATLYPARVCQPVIDVTVVACKMWADNELAVADDRHRIDVAKLEAANATRYNPWVVGVVAVGLTALGFAAGYFAGQYLIP